ncbi:uncharacterized protein LOC141903830 [Tubulanus polymorphus]|uniref:uncharacterized protein LOC141903830 n=1 Tax=Tubulanus polymorphus TaxID=672921 RepID=UPI003DA4D878
MAQSSIRSEFKRYPNHFDMDLLVDGKCVSVLTKSFLDEKSAELSNESLFTDRAPQGMSAEYKKLENRTILLLAFLEYKMGNVSDAIEKLQRVLADEPDNVVAMVDLGIVFWEEFRSEEASEMLRKLKNSQTEEATEYAMANVGYAYRRYGPWFLYRAIEKHERFIEYCARTDPRRRRQRGVLIWKYELVRLIWRIFDKAVGGKHQRFNPHSDQPEIEVVKGTAILRDVLSELDESNFPHFISRCWLLFVQLYRRYSSTRPENKRCVKLADCTPNRENLSQCLQKAQTTLDLNYSSALFHLQAIARELMSRDELLDDAERLLETAIAMGDSFSHYRLAIVQVLQVMKGKSSVKRNYHAGFLPAVNLVDGIRYCSLQGFPGRSPGHPRLKKAIDHIKQVPGMKRIEGILHILYAEDLSEVYEECVECFVDGLETERFSVGDIVIAWASLLHESGRRESAEGLYLLACHLAATSRIRNPSTSEERSFYSVYRFNKEFLMKTLHLRDVFIRSKDKLVELIKHRESDMHNWPISGTNFLLNILQCEHGSGHLGLNEYLTIRFKAAKDLLTAFPGRPCLASFIYRQILDERIFQGGRFKTEAVVHASTACHLVCNPFIQILHQMMRLNEVKITSEIDSQFHALVSAEMIEQSVDDSHAIIVLGSQSAFSDEKWVKSTEMILNRSMQEPKRMIYVWIGNREKPSTITDNPTSKLVWDACNGPKTIYIDGDGELTNEHFYEALIRAFVE